MTYQLRAKGDILESARSPASPLSDSPRTDGRRTCRPGARGNMAASDHSCSQNELAYPRHWQHERILMSFSITTERTTARAGLPVHLATPAGTGAFPCVIVLH